MRTVYVLLLEGGRYYVGETLNFEQRMQQHFGGYGCRWTRRHKPVKVLHKLPEGCVVNPWMLDHVTEHTVAWHLIQKYGYDRCRGWLYLTDNQKNFPRPEKVQYLSPVEMAHRQLAEANPDDAFGGKLGAGPKAQAMKALQQNVRRSVNLHLNTENQRHAAAHEILGIKAQRKWNGERRARRASQQELARIHYRLQRSEIAHMA